MHKDVYSVLYVCINFILMNMFLLKKKKQHLRLLVCFSNVSEQTFTLLILTIQLTCKISGSSFMNKTFLLCVCVCVCVCHFSVSLVDELGGLGYF